MSDSTCPACGHHGDSDPFNFLGADEGNHFCPMCHLEPSREGGGEVDEQDDERRRMEEFFFGARAKPEHPETGGR